MQRARYEYIYKRSDQQRMSSKDSYTVPLSQQPPVRMLGIQQRTTMTNPYLSNKSSVEQETINATDEAHNYSTESVEPALTVQVSSTKEVKNPPKSTGTQAESTDINTLTTDMAGSRILSASSQQYHHGNDFTMQRKPPKIGSLADFHSSLMSLYWGGDDNDLFLQKLQQQNDKLYCIDAKLRGGQIDEIQSTDLMEYFVWKQHSLFDKQQK